MPAMVGYLNHWATAAPNDVQSPNVLAGREKDRWRVKGLTNVSLLSNTKAIGNGPRHYEPPSNDEDDT
ncbi:hypothetical protein TNCV_1910081 [Trichonephila clavipes]|nr:hypothetical protein TNCV_1910081 [Trichonephila clavipes]